MPDKCVVCGDERTTDNGWMTGLVIYDAFPPRAVVAMWDKIEPPPDDVEPICSPLCAKIWLGSKLHYFGQLSEAINKSQVV